MAGNYPDVPGHRMAYDRDGSSMFYWDSASLNTLDSTKRVEANDESTAADFLFISVNAGDPTRYVGLIFPEKRDLAGVHMSLSHLNGTRNNLQWSADTTTGVDGTWSNSIPMSDIATTDLGKEEMRNKIIPVSIAGAKGVRFEVVGGIGGGSDRRYYSFHVFGKPSTGQATDRLRLWHPTLDEEISGPYFDWGDVPRNAVLYKDFRIKNPSTQTANDVTLTAEALTATSPTMVSEFTFSIGGSSYAYPLDIGALAPGTISPVITVRRIVASTAATSLWWSRFIASATSWT